MYLDETLQDTARYDLFHTYHDLYLSEENRADRLRQGISNENTRKLRTNAGDKVTSDAKEVALAKIHGTKYCIPLDHEILRDHGVFYPKALSHHLSFEITLAPVGEIVVYADAVKTPSYAISNLEMEYQTIKSEYLANQAASSYQIGKGFYFENIHHHETFTIARATDSIINKHINVPRRSMTGVLFLFTETYTGGTRDSEKFVNPNITSITFDIHGVPNRLFSKSMTTTDFWESAKKRFGNHSITEKEFYAGDKFALWIDLRTFPETSGLIHIASTVYLDETSQARCTWMRHRKHDVLG